MNKRDLERMMRCINAARPDGVYRCEDCGHELKRLDIDPASWLCAKCAGRMVTVRPEPDDTHDPALSLMSRDVL